MPTAFITGSSQGIGHAFTKHYLNMGWHVVATFRNKPNQNLDNLQESFKDKLSLVELDLENPESIDNLSVKIPQNITQFELIINCAGINSYSLQENRPKVSILQDLDYTLLEKMFKINSIAPVIIVKTLLNLVATNTKIINISSCRASFTDKIEGGNYGYCASKAALNMLTKALAFDLKDQGVIVAAIDPGFVKTKINPMGRIEPIEAVEILYKTIENLDISQNGAFLKNNGDLFPI